MEGIRHSFCLTSSLHRIAFEVAVSVTGGVGDVSVSYLYSSRFIKPKDSIRPSAASSIRPNGY